jgi:phage tail-like protein
MVSSAAGMANAALGGKLTSALGSTGVGSFINALLRTDPEVPYHFSVEIDGIIAGRCKEIDGLKMTTEIQKVREGGNNLFEYSMIKGCKFDDLTIKRGFFGRDSDMYGWMRQMHDVGFKKIEDLRNQKNMAVILMNDKFVERCRFEFYGAFPVEFQGPKMDAMSRGTIGFETIKIHYDWFEFKESSILGNVLGSIGSAALNAV